MDGSSHRFRAASAAVFFVLLAFASSAPAQDHGKPGKALPSPMIVPAKLDVQLFAGDFKTYGPQQTITSPQKVTFRWIPKLHGIARARWEVAASPFSGSATPAILLEGSVGTVPAVHQQGLFDVDFGKFLSPNPPSQPKKYYVRITTFAAGRDATGNASTPAATVIHTKPGAGVTFTAEGLGLTVKQQHPGMYNASPMPIVVDLKRLYIGNDNEGSGDEPYLIVALVYADGTTINPLALSSSTVRVDSPTKTHGNVPDHDKNGDDLEDTSVANIPSGTGHFEGTIKPIGLDLVANMEDADGHIGQAMMDGTAVYVVVIAMEEDASETDAVDAARTAAINGLKTKANGIVQKIKLTDLMDGNVPEFDPGVIQEQLKEKALSAAKNETMISGWWTPALAPIYLDDLVDPDDYVGYGMRRFTFGELLAAAPSGIDFEVSMASGEEGSYTVRGTIRRK